MQYKQQKKNTINKTIQEKKREIDSESYILELICIIDNKRFKNMILSVV